MPDLGTDGNRVPIEGHPDHPGWLRANVAPDARAQALAAVYRSNPAVDEPRLWQDDGDQA
jgi:hypothetical protein